MQRGLRDQQRELRPADDRAPVLRRWTRASVDSANVFTTDGQLQSGKYVILTDPKHIYGFQNVAPVVSSKLLASEGPAFAADAQRGQRQAHHSCHAAAQRRRRHREVRSRDGGEQVPDGQRAEVGADVFGPHAGYRLTVKEADPDAGSASRRQARRRGEHLSGGARVQECEQALSGQRTSRSSSTSRSRCPRARSASWSVHRGAARPPRCGWSTA